ncbi:galanin-like G-protein coupled receptor npr-9 [Aplysia californica]|uniref:Galanin-like G-protein coupled receptor npr-9 n=1 Tax=Aplysia californica TaxID=6500 RepID=A0ABM0JZB1_APLCA|nr:galanin-like G-protein coupled receptor npr-9 [Aplysia californica]
MYKTNYTTLLAVPGFPDQHDWISRELYYTLSAAMFPWFLLTVIGVVGNSLSIVTFFSLGLRDSVTFLFFIQSVSDLLASCATFGYLLFVALYIVEGFTVLRFSFDPNVIATVSVNTRDTFYCMSVLTTTFIATLRCLSVYKPIRFKGFVTARRSYISTAILALVSLAVYGPSSLTYEFQQYGTDLKNISRFVIRYTEVYRKSSNFEKIVGDTIMTLAAQFIVSLCLFVLAHGLVSSIKFRLQSSSVQRASGNRIGPLRKQASSLQGKELQAVRQVCLVALIFVLCNMPKVGIAFGRMFLDGFAIYGKYGTLYQLIVHVRIFTDTINSSVNCFVYYRYNSNFRNKLKEILDLVSE